MPHSKASYDGTTDRAYRGGESDPGTVGATGSEAQEQGIESGVDDPSDPDARITRMKDGRTDLAHKAEHAVDLSSGALLAVNRPTKAIRLPSARQWKKRR